MVILLVILFSGVLICYGLIEKPSENKREFIEYISANFEEAELYFGEKEGWELAVNEEENSLLLLVTTEEGIQYRFREMYGTDDIDKVMLNVSVEEKGEINRGELSIWRDDRGRDIVGVMIDLEPGMVSVKYRIPEFELIDDWGDPGEAELKILRWRSKDEFIKDWEYAEEMMQKLEEFASEDK